MRPNPLLEVLARPERALELSPGQWDLLLRQARHEKVLGRLGFPIEDAGLLERCPAPAADMLRAARAYPAYLQTRVLAELRRVVRATSGLGVEMILLKGAAYLKAGLPLARGRVLADLDLLVRRECLEEVERCLTDLGWEPQKLDAYDQRYYREWMHEIPPLRHPEYGIEVDIHHGILPLTGRLRPASEPFWAASAPLSERRLRVLAPADMILHSAVHLFQDGEIAGGLKDLLDLHHLFGELSDQDGNWRALLQRAQGLGLARPLWYAVTFCRALLGTDIPPAVVAAAEKGAPGAVARRLMQWLVPAVLAPPDPVARASVAAWLLYVRSHWLRMPPALLARHLSRKAWRRLRGKPRGPVAP